MLSIGKSKITEPAFMPKIRKACHNWQEFLDKHLIEYNNLRSYLLEKENKLNGTMYCTYCEKRLTNEDESCIEHIKPKEGNHKLTFDYQNLIISCKSSQTCNNKKGRLWDQNFINPVEDNPHDFFQYQTDGSIDESHPRVRVTVCILNLNYHKLVSSRRVIWLKAMDMPQNDPSLLDSFEDEPSLVAYIKRVYFDSTPDHSQ